MRNRIAIGNPNCCPSKGSGRQLWKLLRTAKNQLFNNKTMEIVTWLNYKREPIVLGINHESRVNTVL